ncbi:proline-rich receptor-like protein kinase PERK14 isoform X1 [Chelonia mydas]|uniref:proline-rich receptor-like protein kinase PERK14 isoform X1 n=1 Tax=Chelonia mydas TaxID=8469 RepID=UPI001CA94A97|nr:proline-rich receptor-like protein kinase PERK14 isoform X1 [Chelonia mydas]
MVNCVHSWGSVSHLHLGHIPPAPPCTSSFSSCISYSPSPSPAPPSPITSPSCSSHPPPALPFLLGPLSFFTLPFSPPCPQYTLPVCSPTPHTLQLPPPHTPRPSLPHFSSYSNHPFSPGRLFCGPFRRSPSHRSTPASRVSPGAPWQGLVGSDLPAPNLPPSGLHSRRVLNTVVSEPGPGLPWFSRVGYVDDQAIFVYASGMQRVEPRTDGAERGSGALGLSAPLVTALGGLDQRESEHPGSALQSDRGYRVSPWYRLFKHLLQKYVLPGMLNGKHQGSNCKRYTSVPLIAKALPQSLPHVKSSPLCSSDSPSVWLLKLSSHP